MSPLPCVAAAKINVPARQWLWPDRLAIGSLTVVDGRKGVGKSALAATVAAAATGGPVLPGQARAKKNRLTGAVVWCGAEEDLGTIKAKLAAAGADLERVYFPGRDSRGRLTHRITLPEHTASLGETCRLVGAALLVLDPLSPFAGADLTQDQPAREVMGSLTTLCDTARVAGWITRHIRKSGGRALEQGLGSTAISNVARVLLLQDEHPETEGMVLATVATNFGPPAAALLYQIVDHKGQPRVLWQGEELLDADQIAEGRGNAGDLDERLDARILLARRIGISWVPAAEVINECRAAGVSERTLRSAKAALKVGSRRVVDGGVARWEWGPPENGWPPWLR